VCTAQQPQCSGLSRRGPRTVPSTPHVDSLPAPPQHLCESSSLTCRCRHLQLNIGAGAGGAFSQFVSLAINSSTGPVSAFNPYADNLHFLIGAYIIEDVVPTAWEVHSGASFAQFLVLRPAHAEHGMLALAGVGPTVASRCGQTQHRLQSAARQ